MILVAELNKPYTEKDRIDFIIEYDRKRGCVVKESTTSIQAFGLTEEEKDTIRKQDIALLCLTGADVERGIYKATGKDFDDVLAMITELQPEGIDIKALKIELKANHFYRGNSYVDAVGSLLGFTKEQLDAFFETNDYTKLISQ